MKTDRLSFALPLATGLAAATRVRSADAGTVNNGDIQAAEAEVMIRTYDTGNTTFDLTVRHVARLRGVDREASVYVVWLHGGESAARWRNLGALDVDHDRSGRCSGATPLRAFELIVTAEPWPPESYPTGKALLYTTVLAE